jgi:hypothetical protein
MKITVELSPDEAAALLEYLLEAPRGSVTVENALSRLRNALRGARG